MINENIEINKYMDKLNDRDFQVKKNAFYILYDHFQKSCEEYEKYAYAKKVIEYKDLINKFRDVESVLIREIEITGSPLSETAKGWLRNIVDIYRITEQYEKVEELLKNIIEFSQDIEFKFKLALVYKSRSNLPESKKLFEICKNSSDIIIRDASERQLQSILHEENIREKQEVIRKHRRGFLSWFKGFDLNEIVSQWNYEDIDTRAKAMEKFKKLALYDCKRLARIKGAVDLIIAIASNDDMHRANYGAAQEILAILADTTGAVEKAMKSIGMKGYSRRKGAGFSNNYTPTLIEILSIEYAKFLNEKPGRTSSAEEGAKIYQYCLTLIKEAMDKLSNK